MDSHLGMEHHVKATLKSVYFFIRQIGKIRRCLDLDSTKKLVHAVITSRLDYCNSLLAGLPASLIGRLQHAQNCAARLVSLTRRRDSISPVLRELHWLPVNMRCQFKNPTHGVQVCPPSGSDVSAKPDYWIQTSENLHQSTSFRRLWITCSSRQSKNLRRPILQCARA